MAGFFICDAVRTESEWLGDETIAPEELLGELVKVFTVPDNNVNSTRLTPRRRLLRHLLAFLLSLKGDRDPYQISTTCAIT